MRSLFLLALAASILALLPAAPARAGGLEDRARILRAEMTRDAAALHPYLKPDADPALRRVAIRALGRIGDDGTGPGILRDILATATPANEKLLADLLWAAGTARTQELAESLAAQLESLLAAEAWSLAAEAARALGWTGADDVATTLRPLVAHAQVAVRAGALEGLARGGAKARADLVAASARVHDDDAGVRAAADYACWLVAGRFAREARKADESWDGDAELAKAFFAHLEAPDADRRMAGLRVLGSLLPKAPATSYGPSGALAKWLGDVDARVVQEVVSRILVPRRGPVIDDHLRMALGHADAKVRTQAAEALGEREGEALTAALERAWAAEQDARVREVLTVALVKHGKEGYWKKLAARDDRPHDVALRQTTEAHVLLGSKRKEALGELFVWADPGASQRAGNLHPAVWIGILGGLEGREHPKLDEWLMGFLAGGYAIDKPDRHFVIASAVGLVGTNRRLGHAATLLKMLGRAYGGPPPHDEIQAAGLHAEIRMALMEAFGELAGAEGCPAEQAAAMRKAVARHAAADPSPWVRRKAGAAAKKLGLEDLPGHDEADQRNTWQGLPRALTPLPGAPAPAGEGDRLDEAAILALADWIAATKPRVVFETTAGSFTVALDPARAPVHCVSLLQAVRDGVYTDTRWHRVVPSFVIQGGDPHGHGGGGGGWTVPDEISRKRFVRGALGMPKSTKDDGGCQIFVMHTTYRPLDERYTCYGDVVEGMDVVDRIRVGDRITKATVILGD